MVKNHCIKFAKRPGVNGIPEKNDFNYEECEYPELTGNTNDEMVVRTLYLSVDPIQRNQMNEETGLSFFKSYQIDEIINGFYGVGIVVESQISTFKPGDVITNPSLDGWPWQVYFKTKCERFITVDTQSEDPKFELSYYGMPGLTSMIALKKQGEIFENKGKGKSFVVSGAAGSCGHLAGQFALLNGCNPVVGICGSDKKCAILKEQLKFTGAINYRNGDVETELKMLCPNGVDVYFDNVGGKIAETVISNMNQGGIVVLCGQISSYNNDEPYPQILSSEVLSHVDKMNIKREAFAVLIHKDEFKETRRELRKLKSDGSIQVLDTVIDGLENAGHAFCSMMKGNNVGKQYIKVSDL